jgi:hypothetical protein
MRLQRFLGTTGDDFTWAMRTNFFAALRATRAALPSMLNQGSGSMVNIGSVNAFFEPDAGVLDYGSAKAALLNLTKSLAPLLLMSTFGSSRKRRSPFSHMPSMYVRRRAVAPRTVIRRRSLGCADGAMRLAHASDRGIVPARESDQGGRVCVRDRASARKENTHGSHAAGAFADDALTPRECLFFGQSRSFLSGRYFRQRRPGDSDRWKFGNCWHGQ